MHTKTVLNAATLHHTCLLVHDVEKAAGKLAQSLSVNWNLWTIAPEHCFVHGEPSPFSFRVGLAQIGGTMIELISPHTGNSVYDAFLKEKGEGYHHICLAYADLQSLLDAKAELQSQGHKIIQHGYTEGVFEFCYFELTEPQMLVELLYLKELPPPEKTIG